MEETSVPNLFATRSDQVSISPTLTAQVYIFWQMEIGVKVSCKMFVKLAAIKCKDRRTLTCCHKFHFPSADVVNKIRFNFPVKWI